MDKQTIKKQAYRTFLTMICFLAGRLIFFKTINPFVTAYLSVFLGTSLFPGAFIFSLLGLLTISKKIYIYRYLGAVFAMAAFNLFLKIKKKTLTPVKRGIAGGICLFLGGSLYAVSQYFSPYYFTIALVEGILTGFLSFLLYFGVRLLMPESNVKTITNEEALSLAILTAGILPGTEGIYILSIPLSAAAAVLIILETMKRSGAAAGIAAAGLTGMFMFFTGIYRCQLIPMLIMGAAAAAIFRKNRFLLPIGFAAGAFPTAFFVYRELASLPYAGAVAAAGAASVFIPKRLYLAISGNISTCITQSETRAVQLQHLSVKKLKEFSSVFERLSKLSGKTDESAAARENNLSMQLAEEICSGCRMKSLCWQKDKNVSDILDKLINEVKKGTKPLYDSLPRTFAENCLRVFELCHNAERIYDNAMINKYWQNRFESSRRLMSAQLKNAADIMNRLRNDITTQLNRDDEQSSRLYESLCKLGASGVSVCHNHICEVFITLYQNDMDDKTEKILSITENLIKKQFIMSSCDYIRERGITQLHLIEKPKYQIAAFSANRVKSESNISGDCHTYMQLDKGRYLLALADGMGSGASAREESAASIEMYEDFMEAGFDRQLSLDIINNILLLNEGSGNNKESFSTLDICTIDLYTGRAEFIKVGAVSTFIIRSGKVDKIRSATLPVGILDNVDTDIYEKNLQCNDIILMMTDGVTDCTSTMPGYDDWIVNLLENTNTTNPKTIANTVIDAAHKSCPTGIRDDMTILAAKIFC